MDAMAHPGKRYLFDSPVKKPAALTPITDTLFDHEVTFTVIGSSVQEQEIEEIRFRTGAVYSDIENAAYILITGGSSDGALINAPVGTLTYPDKGATIIFKAIDLTSTNGIKLQLAGPGIKGDQTCTIDGVREDEFRIAKQLNSRFPLGVDMIFCDTTSVVAIPRSTHITLPGEA